MSEKDQNNGKLDREQIFIHNLNALLNVHPALQHEVVENYLPDNTLSFHSTPSGYTTATYNGRYIHSKHNPVREAERLITTEIDKELDCAIFAGFGLGYHIDAFIEKYPNIPLFVVEPDVPLFLRALHARDMTKILLHQNTTLFLDAEPDALIPLLKGGGENHIKVVLLRSLYEKNKDYFEKVEKTVQSFLARSEVNANTLKRFGRLWVRNLITNLPLLAFSRGIREWKDCFTGIPALLVAAGPSLDRCIPYLSLLAERFVLIAVDTGAYACILGNISPDFLLVVDPQYWNTRHLDRCRSLKTILISESSTHPRVFREFSESPLFFCSSLFPLGSFLEERVEMKGKLGAGGSVATSAWDFAGLLGCDGIYCVGMDLGFSDYQTHYRGSFFEHRAHTFSTRINPTEHFSFTYLYSADPYLAENNSGGRTLTDKRLIIYKWWFENQLKIHRDRKTYSLSPQGVKIEGIPFVPLEELFSFPVIRPAIETIKEKVLSSGKQKPKDISSRCTPASYAFNRATTAGMEQKNGRLQEAVGELSKEMKKVCLFAEEGIEKTRRLKESTGDELLFTELLTELNVLDQKILSSVSKDIVGFLLQEISHNIIESGRKQPTAEEVFANSEKMYKELYASTEYHLQLLEPLGKRDFFREID